ncbi:MAG TPA: YadA-like family protein [Paraburkholderia sp.]|nr:YadA-like family protein [Paraburkholderia sp.]
MKKRQYVTRKRDRYTSIVAAERHAARMRLKAGKARLAAFAVGAASFAGGACAADPAAAEYSAALSAATVSTGAEYAAADYAAGPADPPSAQPAATPQSVSLSALRLLAAVPVTDYIAVSTTVTSGATTHTSNDLNAMAIGPVSAATGTNATAIGAGAFAARGYSTAIGTGTAALAMRVTVVGTGATSGYDADNGVAIGYMSSVDGADSLAIGTLSEAAGNKSVSIGMNAVTDPNAPNSLAMGANAYVSASGSVAIGANSMSNRSNTVSVGNTALRRQIINLAAGTLDTDAVNVAQLKGVAAGLGGGAAVNADGTVTLPSYAIDGSVYRNVADALTNLDGRVTTNTVDIDSLTNTVTNITNTTAGLRFFRANSLLEDASAVGSEAVAIGGNAQASAANAVALGANAVADRANTVSVGATGNERQIANVAAGGLDTDAINVAQLKSLATGLGGGADVNADGTITLPSYVIDGNVYHNAADALTNLDGRVTTNTVDIDNLTSTVTNITNTTAALRYFRANSLLADASAVGSEAVAIGGNAQASAANAVALGANAVADRADTVSVGAPGNERQITSVAAGGFDTDAINVAQLKSMAAGFGGGADVNADGTVTLPSYAIDGNVYHNAADALTNLDGRVTTNTVDIDNLTSTVTNITNTTAALRYFRANSQLADASAAGSEAVAIGGNAQASAANAVALGANAVADRANTVSVGAAGNERQITNVAAGGFDTDAINVAQLKSLATGLGGGADVNADGTLTLPSYTLDGNVYHNVADALTNLDGRVTTNTVDIDNLTSTVTNITNTTAALRYFRASSQLADASATGSEAVAIGGNAQASAANAVALGANAVADRANTVSVGAAGNERQITHVAAGTADTDAVNVRQLKEAGLIDGNGNANSAVTYDHGNGQTDYASVTLGNGVAGGTQIHNVANGVLASDAVNLGQLTEALSQAINNSQPRASNPFVALNGNADGEAARATGTHAMALGANAAANGNEALALGANAVATGDTATALGTRAAATGERTAALGWGSNASADGAVALGAGSVADRANTVSVGSVGSERQIANVAPGTRGTDAVNLDQLNAAFNQTNQALSDLDRNTRKGIASASALQIVTPYLPGRTTLNAGVAAYRGQAALGIGVSRWNDKGTLNFNAGVASSGGNSTIVRAGVGIVIGD